MERCVEKSRNSISSASSSLIWDETTSVNDAKVAEQSVFSEIHIIHVWNATRNLMTTHVGFVMRYVAISVVIDRHTEQLP
jgi:hypothetical protein